MRSFLNFTILISLLMCGCAKFNLTLSSLSSTAILSILSPATGSNLVGAVLLNITGTCDQNGGMISLSGTSIQGGGPVTGNCISDGTFSISITTVASGAFLDVTAEQLNVDFVPMTSVSNNLMIHCAGAPLFSCSLSGSGNLGDSYVISDIACLQEMRTGLNCHYSLANNIDASSTATWNGGAGWEPVPPDPNTLTEFTGTLDGQGYTISNLTISERNAFGTGIFSRVGDEGNGLADIQIRDLNLNSVTITGNRNVGSVVGSIDTSSIDNVVVSGVSYTVNDLTAFVLNVGGIVGDASNAVFTNLEASGNIFLEVTVDAAFIGIEFIGGLIGSASSNSVVQDSIANVTIDTAVTNVGFIDRVGGAIGFLSSSQVSNLIQTGDVTVNTAHTSRGQAVLSAGGSFGGMSQSSSAQRVCQDSTVIINCDTRVRNTGGFVGLVSGDLAVIDQISIRGSFTSTVNTADNSWVGGFTGHNFDDANYTNIVMSSSVTFNGPGTSASVAGGIGHVEGSPTVSNFGFFGSLSITNPNGGRLGVIAGRDNGTPVFNSVFYDSDNDGGYGAIENGPYAGITAETTLNLNNQANAVYSGWDFTIVPVWSRLTPLPNLPYLTVCP